jgi:THO complex subunit 4
MVDYFSNENAPAEGNAPVNGAAPQATNGGEDLGMAEISVCSL